MIGQVIGNYKITEKIGEGGMGDVFKGMDFMLEREVAIKMLRPELARQQPIVGRFRAEAVTLAKLNHPNIATLYNFVRQGNDFFMIMEYVKGHTFERMIKQFGAMPVQRAVQLFAQALEGIAHAHRLGVIHRDLKPANVMLMDSGLIKVMDFGIARVLGSNRITRTGNVIGTIEYMSPEQVRGEETDARSDIYSAGILLYEMLTGRVPFDSASEYELMRRQVEDAPMPPRLFTKEIPVKVEQVIMRALAKKPEARFQSADEFRAVLGKSFDEATAMLVNASASAQSVVQKQATAQTPIADSPKAFDVPKAEFASARKPMPTTLDFTSDPQPAKSKEVPLPKSVEPQPPVNKMPLPQAPQAILKETRLAEEAKAEWAAQQLKETRFAEPDQVQAAQVAAGQHALSSFSPEDAPQQKTSFLAGVINKLNWKHYAAVMVLALCSIPLAFIASSGDPTPTNRNQSTSTTNTAQVTEQKREPAAQPATSSNVIPKPPNAAPDVDPSASATPGGSASQQGTSEGSNKKARRAGSRQQSQSGEHAAKKRDHDDSDKKEEKKEKKGGLFDKVKGGLKKINPFKKD
jgi:serine/threonine protein kinase